MFPFPFITLNSYPEERYGDAEEYLNIIEEGEDIVDRFYDRSLNINFVGFGKIQRIDMLIV